MTIQCHHLDKWEYKNLDLVEEVLESHKKCVVCIGGASSSGKSFCAKNLGKILNSQRHKAIVMSSDNYNKGISGIITDKVEKSAFNGKLPNKAKVLAIVKETLLPIDFEDKFNKACLALLRKKLQGVLSPNDLNRYLSGCQAEIQHLNFDEPTVYDLPGLAEDLKILLAGGKVKRREYSKVLSEQVASDQEIDGRAYSVFIVEGIYAISGHFLGQLDKKTLVTDFIEGSPKSLFLRRIIRDAKITSSPTFFTIQMYFNNIVKSYNETILPSKRKADVVFKNDMTFQELREGTLYLTKEKCKATNPVFVKDLLSKSTVTQTLYQKDVYLKGSLEPSDFNNQLRFRLVSNDKGKTYQPSSLVHKGAPKTRKDGKEIRPINILLKEGEFFKAFKSEKDFLKKMKEAGFEIERISYKIKRRLNYRGFAINLIDVKNDATYLELPDPRMPQTMKVKLLKLGSE